ncbi:MAG TPA: hypothetical protein VLX60_14920 [Terriglobales bacterium]|nr:hypothetical protein [Terriglobales bacterium]
MTNFQALRVTHQFTQTNLAPPQTVFPLLCPVREADWVPGWQYRLIYSESGVAEAGCVFITEENGRETTWIVTEYDSAAFRIAFVWVDPGMVTAQIRIQLEPAPAATSASHSLEGVLPSQKLAAERRQNKAHGVSRGYKAVNNEAPEGRKIGDATTAHIQYTYTALSPEGNREVERFTETWFRHKMQSWESAINHYLRTGKRIDAPTWE